VTHRHCLPQSEECSGPPDASGDHALQPPPGAEVPSWPPLAGVPGDDEILGAPGDLPASSAERQELDTGWESGPAWGLDSVWRWRLMTVRHVASFRRSMHGAGAYIDTLAALVPTSLVVTRKSALSCQFLVAAFLLNS
jgi:hypothetical protein